MDDLLPQLPLCEEVKDALQNGEGTMATLLKAVSSYEMKDGSACLAALNKLGIDKKEVYPCYLESIAFCRFLDAV
jgi:c-di-GMP-related signal transduction protein